MDFTVEVQRSLRVLDGSVAVFDSVAGVEPQSETVWRQANDYGVPRIAYVNKMDRTGADYAMSIQTMIDRLGANAIPIQLPIGAEGDFEGIIDLVEFKAIYYRDDLGKEVDVIDIPEDLLAEAEEAREKLLDAVADHNDEVMELHLEGDDVPVDLLKKAIRAATIDLSINPVLCGSSFKNKGVQPLLDAVVDYLPSPLDVPAIKGWQVDKTGEQGDETERASSDEGPFAAIGFKIMTDPHVGALTFFRVYSGTLDKGQSVLNPRTGKQERIGRILLMHANNREDVDKVYAGDIAAAVGLKNVITGDTLCASSDPVVLESMNFPEPVIKVSVEPKTKSDQEKMSIALGRLAQEDPTFRVETNEESGQTEISGMGELHLEVLVDRMKREFKVEANVGRPQVSYRETVKSKAENVEGRFVRQTGGSGQFGIVYVNVEPNVGEGFDFINSTKGGSVPSEYIKAVRQGVEEAMDAGPLAGYPLVDCKFTLIDGKSHDTDSSEIAFKVAGSLGAQEAVKRAKPTLLEPIFAVTVVTPEDYVGDVIGDLSRRRGRVEGQERRGNAIEITARVPLSEMFGYATDLRSMSQGRAAYTMQFDSYDEVPPNVAEKVIGERRGEAVTA